MFSPPPTKYRSDIDGLRAIAVISVIAFHAFGVKGGFSGVDIFFVLSGYLITTIIFENLEKGRFSFLEFYSRRIKRIFPALALVLISCLFLGWVLLFADEYEQLGWHIFSGVGFFSNFTLLGESGYFDVSAEKKPLLHLWSLAIEEQYYILWPLVVYFMYQWRINLGLVITSLLVGLFLFNIFSIQTNPVATFYLPHTRFWELLVGSFIAYLMVFKKNQVILSSNVLNVLSVIGLSLITFGIVFLNNKMAFPGWWALLPTVGTALIIFSGSNNFISQKILSNRVFVWIGLISYPLYLWHWPLLSFLKILGDQPKFTKLAAVIGSIFLAWLTQKYVEAPIRFGKRHFLGTTSLVLIMVFIGFLGLVVNNSSGFPSRISDGADGALVNKYRYETLWPEANNHSKECLEKFGGDQYCLINKISLPPTAVIIGDSHANHFYFGLNDYVESRGGNLLLLGAGACLPFFGIDRGRHPQAGNVNCYIRTNKFYDYILKQDSIKTVVFSFVHNEPFRNDIQFIDRWGEINHKDNYLNAVEAFVRTIKLLREKDKKVIVIYDLPNLVSDPKDCFYKRPFVTVGRECRLDRLEMIMDFDRYSDFLKDVKSMVGFDIFYTHQYLSGNFPLNSEGVLTYRDATHLSMTGSKFFSKHYNFLD
jgi:peptidoglycan/LPS O-acetylase OafA/YrhL